MSNNYYFKDKKVIALEKRVKKIQEELKALEGEVENVGLLFKTEFNPVNIEHVIGDSGQLHIGQTVNGGAAPLLQQNTRYYNNVKEMKEFYEGNKDRLIILNEYDEELTWEDLKKELLNKQGSTRGDYVDEDGYCWSRHEFS